MILVEVRAVTITQKEIEAKLSGDLWDRQMRWNQNKEAYYSLLKSLHDFTEVTGNLSSFIDQYNRADAPLKQKRLNGLTERVGDLNEARASITLASCSALIFANEECRDIIVRYSAGSSAPLHD